MNQNAESNNHTGIDDMSLYVPNLYFDIKDFATAREMEYGKLSKGLGLLKMAIPDAFEDAATMAANAVADLIEKNNLNPTRIGRLYLGTESALDGSKPTATYILEMLHAKYKDQYGEDCFRNCDVVDLTFACIGAVDALQNTLDWVSNGSDRIGIVVASDFAKYELGSSGEYTQGAGAVALLAKQNPRLLAFEPHWGVATHGVHDFYKPKRKVTKAKLVEEVLHLAALQNGDANVQRILSQLPDTLEVNGVLDSNDADLVLHKDTPVFDGQYSNKCYQDRIGEAYEHLLQQKAKDGSFDKGNDVALFDTWAQLVFHLPYAFHAKRIFSDIFVTELKRTGKWADFVAANAIEEPQRDQFEDEKSYQKALAGFLRAVTKTDGYRTLVKTKIHDGQRASQLVGNMYTASIFLSLMGVLEVEHDKNTALEGQKLGFLAYGSGSKSKVFEATVQPTWKEVVSKFRLFEGLEQREAINENTYLQLHKGAQAAKVKSPHKQFALANIGESGVTVGARYYEWHG